MLNDIFCSFLFFWGHNPSEQLCIREQLHVVCGAFDAQPFPTAELRDLTAAVVNRLKAVRV